jgi:hypothetical protein
MKKVKDHGSDDEGEEDVENTVAELSQYEKEMAELEAAPTISRHEISPAAFIFAQTDEERQQILFEEK